MAKSAANAIDLVACNADPDTGAAKNNASAAGSRKNLVTNKGSNVGVVDSIRGMGAHIDYNSPLLRLDVIAQEILLT